MLYLDLPDPLIVIVGPTAVGKTSLAVDLAKIMNGEIVSADSRLFYRGLDIGTAKPDPHDLHEVLHHLIDVAGPEETWSLVQFQDAAKKAISEIHARNHLPCLVGGTGQYIQAVVEGWQAPVQEPDMKMRQTLEQWAAEIGPPQLFERLKVLDRQAASQIESRNLRRIVRALEVIFTTGKRFSEQKLKTDSPYSLCIIGLKRPRPELFERVDARIEQMIAHGLLDEVENLLKMGYSPHSPALSAIGYREMVAVIQGGMTIEAAVVQMKRRTRQFIRRQSNWFKESDPRIHWFDAAEPLVLDEIINCIEVSGSWIRKKI
jgi:tRNA dimethylallyltransferase